LLDDLFPGPKARARVGRSWLQGPIDGFLCHLAAQRFNWRTLRNCAYQLLAFGEFTARQGVGDLAALPLWVETFAAQVGDREGHRHKVCLAILRFLGYLRHRQVIPAAEAVRPPVRHADLMEDYLRGLYEQRGVCPDSLVVMRQPCQALLTFAAAEGITDLRSLQPEAIHRFVAWQATRCNRRTLRSRCCVVRNFLSYLHRRGVVAVDLAPAVLAPRVYQREQCPRFLTRTEIDAALAVVDRSTPLGRRDYAMVLLLAVYGLRGLEVLHLRLEDVDWRRQLVHVRSRKAGNSTTYPLSMSVGEAILAYLQQGRPPSTHREIFLTTTAPFTPLATSDSLASRVKKYLAKAGVHVERPGTHSFRYSCAQRLFDDGLPLKIVADYLGHRDLRTTQRYTLIALDQLREVATGDGEDLL